MRFLYFGALAFGMLPAVVCGRDVYGNATPWTTSDSIISELHQQQNKYVPPSSGQPSWESQIAGRNAAKRQAAQQAARDAVETQERNARIAQREAEYRPLTWAQEMARYVLQEGDRAAAEGEELAFYYVNNGELPKARHHLEMVIYRKRPRAGEAAWQLYQLFKEDGPEPHPQRAAEYLEKATSLGYSAGLWGLAVRLYQGDPARGVPADPNGAIPFLETLFSGTDRRFAADAGRLLLAHNLQTPGRETHAVAVMRRLQATAGADRASDGTLLAMLLINSAGSWKEHSAEIVMALRSAPMDGESHELLARIYLGIEQGAAAYIPPHAESAGGALRSLARLNQPVADALLAHLLAPGADQRLPAAEILAAELFITHPDSPEYVQRYADVLWGQQGGRPNLLAALKIFEPLAAQPKALPAVLSATARLLSTDLPGRPADRVAAFALWERAAKQWDRYAQYRYAEALLRGIGCVANPVAAREYMEATTRDDRPNASAYPLYALYAQALRESAPTDSKVLRQASALAARPDRFPPADLETARCIHARSKVESAREFDDDEPSRAFAFADRAARSGLSEARLLLAAFYREGFGTTIDLEAAYEIYSGGVTAEVPMAMAALAEMQLGNIYRYHDAAAGFALASRAALAGDPRGLYLVGRCYLQGEGVEADPARATEALTRSAAAGDVDAMTCLAGQRLGGIKQDPAEYARSLENLQKAAVGGSLEAAVRLFNTLAADPNRTPDRLKKLNHLLGSGTWEPPDDEALLKDAELVSRAGSQLALLTGQRRDPALSYETAMWLLGEKSELGSPTGLTYYSDELISMAAQAGHVGALYYDALQKIRHGRTYLETPEDDVLAYKDWDSKHSAGHLAEGLDAMRASADGGEPRALAYLASHDIPLVSPVAEGAIDQSGIEKIDPRVRGGRREGEYVIALRAMRLAREYLAKPEKDAPLRGTVGPKYSDAYFDEALKYFRSSAAAGLPEAAAYLAKHGIAQEGTEQSAPFDRATLAKTVPLPMGSGGQSPTGSGR